MTHRLPLLAALAATTMTAACGTSNRGLESAHQPVVARSDFVLDVRTDYAGLSAGESQRLAGWMETLSLGYGDSVAIDDPNGAGAQTRTAIAAVAARFGLLLADQAPVTGAPVEPGTVRVVVSRTHASVPGCPDYTRTYVPNFNAHTSSNYGCAINTNLARMIANPTDLVRGAQDPSGTYDARSGTRAISTMRDTKPTGDGGTWVKSKAETTGGK